MKKIFFLFLSTYLTLTIISCGEEKEEFTATTNDNTTTTDDSLRSRLQAVVNNIQYLMRTRDSRDIQKCLGEKNYN